MKFNCVDCMHAFDIPARQAFIIDLVEKLPDLKKLLRPVYVNLGCFPKVTSDIQNASEYGLKGTYTLNSD